MTPEIIAAVRSAAKWPDDFNIAIVARGYAELHIVASGMALAIEENHIQKAACPGGCSMCQSLIAFESLAKSTPRPEK